MSTPYDGKSTTELREECDSRGIEYTEKTRASALIKKLVKHDEGPPRELDGVLSQISKSMGDGVALRPKLRPRYRHVPTGDFLLDFSSGGGYMEGQGHMIYGYEGCGKTTLCKKMVASTLTKYPGGEVAWVDCEHKFDQDWAERMGVDLDRVILVQPNNGEQAVDMIEGFAKSKEINAVVLDSIPALNPLRILNKSAEDSTVAERARLVGLLCSKIQQVWLEESRRGHFPTLYAINQFRSGIGTYGNPNTLPGGRYQGYLVMSKLFLKKQEAHKDINGIPYHEYNTHPFKFEKTKGMFGVKSGETMMIMDDSIRDDNLVCGQWDDFRTVLTFAMKYGMVEGSGSSWYIHGYTSNGVRVRSKSHQDIIDKMMEDEDLYLRMKRTLIVAKRRQSAIPDLPPDGYLLGHVTEEESGQINETLRELGYGE